MELLLTAGCVSWVFSQCQPSACSSHAGMPPCPFLSNLWAGRELGVLPHRPLWLRASCCSTKGSSWTLSRLVLLHHGGICLLPCLDSPRVTPLLELKEIFSAMSLTPIEQSRSFLQIFPYSSSLCGEFWNSKIYICLLRAWFLQEM